MQVEQMFINLPCVGHWRGMSSASQEQLKYFDNSPYSQIPYPIMHHSEQKGAHFCSEWDIVEYGTGALWHLWDWCIV